MTELDVAIVGAGFAGLGLGIRLKRRGVSSFLIFERANAVGGTWRDNTYPGVACDVPSHLYSWSFRPNPRWSSFFSEGAEIRDYLVAGANEEGLDTHLRLGTDVDAMTWDESRSRWELRTSRGEFTARTLVLACGRLTEPRIPDVPGLDTFRGPMFHSARWDHDADLRGKRVAVVGSGASAIQLVPRVAELARELVVLQRSAPYVIPREEHHYTDAERALFERDPAELERLQVGAVLDGRGGLRPARGRACGGRCCAQAGTRPPRRTGARPRTAGRAHAALRDRLQARSHLERVLPRSESPDRDGRTVGARGRERQLVDHRQRRAARGRRGDLRHRIPCGPAAVRPHRPGCRRRAARATLGRRHDRLRVDCRQRLPQPVRRQRPQRRSRAQLGDLHDRDATRLHSGRTRPPRGRHRPGARRESPGRRRVHGTHRRAGSVDRVDDRRMRKLVPRRTHRQAHPALAGLRAHVPRAQRRVLAEPVRPDPRHPPATPTRQTTD